MKQFSIGLNILVLAAVGYLYFLHFSENKKSGQNTAVVANKTPEINTGGLNKIAYLDLDSLNEHIGFIKETRRKLESEQKGIETEWEAGYKTLEADKNNFLKRASGNPGSVSQDEAEKFQHSLTQRQQIIDEKKQSQSQALNKRSFEFMDDLQKKLKDFLREYNKGKNYSLILSSGTGLDYMVYKDSTLNISGDVIKGMNEKMSAYSKR